jgi:hypothetical protein
MFNNVETAIGISRFEDHEKTIEELPGKLTKRSTEWQAQRRMMARGMSNEERITGVSRSVG